MPKELYLQQHCWENFRSRTNHSGRLNLKKKEKSFIFMKYLFIYLFIRCIASHFKLWCLRFSLSSSSSSLSRLPCLPIPFMFPYIFHSATCFIRQFLCKMWTIQSAFLVFTLLRKFLSSLTPRNTFPFFTSVQRIFSKLLQHHVSKFSGYFLSMFGVPKFLTLQSYAPDLSFHYLRKICWWKNSSSGMLLLPWKSYI